MVEKDIIKLLALKMFGDKPYEPPIIKVMWLSPDRASLFILSENLSDDIEVPLMSSAII